MHSEVWVTRNLLQLFEGFKYYTDIKARVGFIGLNVTLFLQGCEKIYAFCHGRHTLLMWASNKVLRSEEALIKVGHVMTFNPNNNQSCSEAVFYAKHRNQYALNQ